MYINNSTGLVGYFCALIFSSISISHAGMQLSESGYVVSNLGDASDPIYYVERLFNTNQNNYYFNPQLPGTSSGGSSSAVVNGSLVFDRFISDNFSRIKWSFSASYFASEWTLAGPSENTSAGSAGIEDSWVVDVNTDKPLYYSYTVSAEAFGGAQSTAYSVRDPQNPDAYDYDASVSFEYATIVDHVRTIMTNIYVESQAFSVPRTVTYYSGLIQPQSRATTFSLPWGGGGSVTYANYYLVDASPPLPAPAENSTSSVNVNMEFDLILSTSPIPPVLAATRSGTGMIFSWPANATNCSLQVSDTLFPSANWLLATNTAVISGDKMTTTVDFSASQRYYRLASVP